jgi:hypothetical protein
MLFQERAIGEYRVYAGAVESTRGGYMAALIIQQMCSRTQRSRDVHRDESLACGHAFRTPQEALDYAMNRAREVLAREPTGKTLPRAA